MKKSGLVVFFILVLAVILGCAPLTTLPTPTPTLTQVPPTSTPIPPTFTPAPTFTATIVPTPVLNFAVPTPMPGTGNLIGQVLWNKEPMHTLKVLLCENYGDAGCTGKEYGGATNDQGYYVFKNIKPGRYAVVINIPNTDWYIHKTNGGDLVKDKVVKDQTTYLEPRSIFKVNLNTDYPIHNSTIAEITPTLKWREYKGASYYMVTLQKYNGAVEQSARVEKTEYTVEKRLSNCEYYQWTVEAYNDEGDKIAQSTSFLLPELSFRVVLPNSAC